jgi:plastocyanin
MRNPRHRSDARLAVLALALAALAPRPALAGGGVVAGKVDVQPMKYQDETVVYLRSVPGPHAPRVRAMDQKGMKFLPFVLPVAAGDTVDFLNHDGVEHNVFTPDNEVFNLGTFRSEDKRSYTFEKPGVYRIRCSIHPEMLGYVFVGENPYLAVLDRKARFRIEGVPPGTYQLAIWNAHLAGPEKTVTVAAGKTTEETLTLRR